MEWVDVKNKLPSPEDNVVFIINDGTIYCGAFPCCQNYGLGSFLLFKKKNDRNAFHPGNGLLDVSHWIKIPEHHKDK